MATTSYAQAFTNEISRAAKEAWEKMMKNPEVAFYLYFKRNGLRLHIIREDESAEGLELAHSEKLPGDRTQEQLAMLFHAFASRLPLLPTD